MKTEILDPYVDIESNTSERDGLREEIRKLNEELNKASTLTNQNQYEINQLEYENQSLEDTIKTNQEKYQEVEK